MKIDNLEIASDLKDILDKLIFELQISGSKLFSKGIRSSGDYYSVQCPYHKFGQERHPSAQFRKSDGLFYCFGCKEVHSLPEVITHCLSVNGKNWLRENFEATSIEQRKVSFNIPTREAKAATKYIDKSALAYFRYTHPYMFKRKLNLDTIRKFDVGYDKENDCITFPNKNINGDIVFIATRSINTKFFHYPEYVDKVIYGLYEIYREIKHGTKITEVYVCESILDCLAIWSWGKYAVALNGTGSKYQYDLFKRCDIRILILATDNDDAGHKARERFKECVTNKIIKEIDYISYKDCKDINDMEKEQFLNAKIV